MLRSSYVGSNTTRPLDKAEFRGFALVDPLVPVVFINAGDYKSAQIFTLAHELAHIWVGESGVSNLDYDQRSSAQRAAIDRVCDRIAAESLVPSRDFQSGWDRGTGIERNLQSLGSVFKVSQFVILRRAREESLVNESQFHAYNELLKSGDRIKPVDKKKKGGDFYSPFLSAIAAFSRQRYCPRRTRRCFVSNSSSSVKCEAEGSANRLPEAIGEPDPKVLVHDYGLRRLPDSIEELRIFA